MAEAKPESLLSFPTEFPAVSRGVLTSDGKHLVTGHSNGFVVEWRLGDGAHRILQECGSRVRALELGSDGFVYVACYSGLTIRFHPDRPASREEIRPGPDTTQFRVFTACCPSSNSVAIGSTYGEVSIYTKVGTSWENQRVGGHSQGVFAIAANGSGLLATGDYRGNIVISKLSKGRYLNLCKTAAPPTVEGLGWVNGGLTLASISSGGAVTVLEPNATETEWRSVLSASVARSVGRAVYPTPNGETVFGCCAEELVQLDLENEQAAAILAKGGIRTFFRDGALIILDAEGLWKQILQPVEVSPKLVRFRYSKISVVGHTGVGKSSLCRAIVTGKLATGDAQSTFGRRVWTYEVPSTHEKRRLIMGDLGGQFSTVETLLPTARDSDIVLACFQQNDSDTLERAVEILRELKGGIGSATKVFLVQTYTDQDVSDVNDRLVQSVLKEKLAGDILKVSSRRAGEIDAFKTRLLAEVPWSTARVLIQSPSIEGLEVAIKNLRDENVPVATVADVSKAYERATGKPISHRRLEFLLQSFADQGLVDFAPGVSDLVILDDPDYNQIRTLAGHLAQQYNGLVTISQLKEGAGPNPRFVEILDQFYLRTGVAIENGTRGLRIFPKLLRSGVVEMPGSLSSFFLKSTPHSVDFGDVPLNLRPLIVALSDLGMECADATQSEGLFTWREKAAVYFSVSTPGNVVTGLKSRVTFFSGGSDAELTARAESEFESLLERLYGEGQDTSEEQGAKKKTLRHSTST
jgi:GTPase SAR1 family protein